VCLFNVFFNIRRTHATGGSNSTADGGPPPVEAADFDVGVVVVPEAALPVGWFSFDEDVSGVVAVAAAATAADGTLLDGDDGLIVLFFQ
jgi:hypothetical protein